MSWPQDQIDRLAELHGKGYGYLAIAETLNDEFKTDHTDASCRGQAQRAGLVNDGTKRNGNGRPVAAHHQTLRITPREGERFVIMSDAQVPFHDPATFAALLDFLGDFEPEYLFVAGDWFDFYPVSSFEKDPAHRMTLQDELDVGRELLIRAAQISGAKRKVFIDGNHEDRLRRYLQARGPGVLSLRDLDPGNVLGLGDDWEHLAYKSWVDFGGYLIEHGEQVSAQSGATARRLIMKRGCSGYCGHTHRLAAVYNRDVRTTHVWTEGGCLCLLESSYIHNPDWQQGFVYGFVRDKRPRPYAVWIEADGFRAEGRWYPRSPKRSRR